MTETVFVKNLKKWFWGTMLAQIIVGATWVVWTGGAMNASTAKNTEQIRALTEQMNQKADIQMVLRIKGDQDRVQQMILENTREIKVSQDRLYEALINHISKEPR